MAEARTKKLTNPFYIALLFVGGIFGITACSYVVMMVIMADPGRIESAAKSTFLAVMSRHGTLILMVELGMLGVLTLGAIATDDYWTGEGREPEKEDRSATKRAGIDGINQNP